MITRKSRIALLALTALSVATVSAAAEPASKGNQALVAGKTDEFGALAHGWPYAGYKVAVFSKGEEQQIEAPQLDGHTPYYNDEALASAGAKIQHAQAWSPNAVEDRELVTGQQPFSDKLFADAFVAKLDKAAR